MSVCVCVCVGGGSGGPLWWMREHQIFLSSSGGNLLVTHNEVVHMDGSIFNFLFSLAIELAGLSSY